MDNKIKQLRKGVLELAIMSSLYGQSHYGYSLVKSLSAENDVSLTEGTIYPILNRLSKEGLVQSQWVESRQGPPRKYYSLTPEGKSAFQILFKEFRKLESMVRGADDPKPGGAKPAGPALDVLKELTDGE
jgi:PadR family transcriptional regulator PadR